MKKPNVMGFAVDLNMVATTNNTENIDLVQNRLRERTEKYMVS